MWMDFKHAKSVHPGPFVVKTKVFLAENIPPHIYFPDFIRFLREKSHYGSDTPVRCIFL